MNSIYLAVIIAGLLALAAAFIFLRGRDAAGSQATKEASAELRNSVSLIEADGQDPNPLPTAIHFGTDALNPAVTLRPLPLPDQTSVSKTSIVEPSLGVSSRLSALMQAAPSLLVAEAHRGRQLMEVVVNGQLIRAADGNGFRAMTMGPNGINGHARLFDAKDLTNLVNAAAVWQFASVIVAQKHMADISQKLSEIKDAVNSISDHLDSGRRSVIHGTYQYLQQAYEALTHGELISAIRGELESCERELLSVQNHLMADINRRAKLAPRDDDTFGTESLHKNSVEKYRELGQVVEDLNICLRTRALSWYVLSLYPGEHALKAARSESIKQGLDEFKHLQSLVKAQCEIDLERFKSVFNFDNTLEARKSEVRRESGGVQRILEAARLDTSTDLTQTQTLLLKRDCPTQLIVELVDGVVKQVRQRELMAAA